MTTIEQFKFIVIHSLFIGQEKVDACNKIFRVNKEMFILFRRFGTIGPGKSVGWRRDGKHIAKKLVGQYNFAI